MLQPNRSRLRDAAHQLGGEGDFNDVADWLRLLADEEHTLWQCVLPWAPPSTPGEQAEDTAMHIIRAVLFAVPPEAQPRIMAYWRARAEATATAALPI